MLAPNPSRFSFVDTLANGGRLDLKDAPRGGVEAHIELPLDELLADAR